MSLLTLASSEYHAFAQFTFSATTYSVGTQTELRSGVWYDGVLKSAPPLQMDFASPLSLTAPANVDLVIGDGAGGTYRTLVDGNILDGVVVTLTLVVRQKWNDLSITELTYGQQLTIVGTSLAPGLVTLRLQDLEDKKLAALYPLNTWKASDWGDLLSDDAGKSICEPVGTAIKLPCVLLRSDTLNNEYWYGVCTGTAKTFPITAVNTGTKQFTVTGNCTGIAVIGGALLVNLSTANDGAYTIASATISGGNTLVVVNEVVPSATANGNIHLMPMPLTVYRNKRIVAASEYLDIIGYVPGTIANGNFAGGGTGWPTTVVGAGSSVSFAGGVCTIVSVNAANYAYIAQFGFGGATKKGGWYAVQVTVGAGADAIIGKNGPPQVAAGRRLPAGATTTVIIDSNVSGGDGFAISVWNYAGTAVITNVRFIPLVLTMVKFSTPQIDFNGTPYVIEADVLGVESRNCSAEIQRLLILAGVATDSTTFTAAIGASFTQLLDCDYGRSGQRKISAILDDLLYVARGGLSRNATGNYTIWQDVSGAATVTMDESLGDSVQVDKIESVGRPATVGLNFAPSSGDVGTMQQQITRPVTGGVLGAENPREIRYLRDATTADQLLCYRALRSQYCRIATATIYRVQQNIGDKITLTSPKNWVGARTFTAWGLQRVPSGNKLTLMEYNAAVYTYTANSLVVDARSAYQPDYSATPPAAPTALVITATGTNTDGSGNITAYVTCKAVPPLVNWQTLWFVAIHNVAGIIGLVQATLSGGIYQGTISGLRPGEVYKLQCYAANSKLQGAVLSTFDATAIGGGGAATTFTTAGTALAPATVSSCAAAQKMGKYIDVTWPVVANTDIQAYVLEQQVGAGAFAEVWRGNSLKYTDSAISYGTAFTYRVRALNIYGTFSAAYATSGSVTPVSNVSGGGSSGDIKANTVATANRTGVSTASHTWSLAGSSGALNNTNFSITHSLGVLPLVGTIVTGAVFCICNLTARSTTDFTVNIVNMNMNGTFPVAGAIATIAFNSIGSTTASIDFW